jgi:hypothetical protein
MVLGEHINFSTGFTIFGNSYTLFRELFFLVKLHIHTHDMVLAVLLSDGILIVNFLHVQMTNSSGNK